MRYNHDKLTGHKCLYNSLFAIGWLPGGETHWVWEWPYVHFGIGPVQFCLVAD